MRDRSARVEWSTDVGRLLAYEPSDEALRAAALALAEGYNEPHNRAMLANTVAFTADDVVLQFASVRAQGARPFLLSCDGVVMGDADLRHIDGGEAEFALLIARRGAQGRGLGTRFARMLHVFAFRALGLSRTYVTIVPENTASLRVFAKLGYQTDTTAAARAFADGPTDISLSLTRDDFERANADALRAVIVA